jgi:hypothetical protein
MSIAKALLSALAMVTAVAAYGWTADSDAAAPPSPPTSGDDRPLPPPVEVRQEPDGVALGDPAFEALPGARAEFGQLGGAVYQIEVPDDWNGRLVLFMHGFEELGPEANVTAPDARRYLIGHGIAWGASSFSSTSLIPGRAADETAALWDYFARTYGRPTRSYITGFSMGGAATHISAERYADRFDGALAQCGAAGQTPALMIGADFFVVAAYVAGVTQAEFDATSDIGGLIRDRILPALDDPATHDRFERIMVDLTGGPRAFGREGFHLEEETNWRRVELLVAARLAPNRDKAYRLGPLSPVTSEEFNRNVIRLQTNDEGLRSFVAGNETTGNVQMPLLTTHTTGDGQVPIEQARILQRRVDAAGKGKLLVQRVVRDPSHCGFTTTEWVADFEDVVDWVEHSVKPKGMNVLMKDLRTLEGTFELQPRRGTPEAGAVPGARDRVVFRGRLTVDGEPFDARFLGAIVLRDDLVAPCQYTLPTVEDGRYEITVFADAETAGCGAKGARIALWTFLQDTKLYSNEVRRWPGDGETATFNASFSTSAPRGAAPQTTEFAGEVFDRRGRHLSPGTRIEAYVGNARCGVGSVRRTGNFSGYLLAAVGPDLVAGCERGAVLTFRIDGRRAADTAVNEPGRGTYSDLTLR